MTNKPNQSGRPAMDPAKKRQSPSLSLSPETVAALTEANEKTGISMSALVEACVKQRLTGIVAALVGNQDTGESPPRNSGRR